MTNQEYQERRDEILAKIVLNVEDRGWYRTDDELAIDQLILDVIGEDAEPNIFTRENPLWPFREQYNSLRDSILEDQRGIING